MNKAILITDMPDGCSYCDFCHVRDYDHRYKIDGDKYCCIEDIDVNDYYDYENPRKPSWCPLIPLPEKRYDNKVYREDDWFMTNPISTLTQYERGWNDCIEKILEE